MTGPADRRDDLPYDVAGALPSDLPAAPSRMPGVAPSPEIVDTALEPVTGQADVDARSTGASPR